MSLRAPHFGAKQSPLTYEHSTKQEIASGRSTPSPFEARRNDMTQVVDKLQKMLYES